MTSTDAADPARDDPRVRRSRDKILAATWEQLAACGYEGLTIEGVARHAGVGKATVYRHWASKAELVIDAAHHLRSVEPAPAEGTTAERITRNYQSLARRLADPGWSGALPALLDAAGRHDRVAGLFVAFVHGRRRGPEAALRDGIAAGDLPADTDVDATLDELAGPLFYRRFFTSRGIAAAEVADLVRRVLADPPRTRSASPAAT
jgi:AcrR family transcriptional regulator